MSAAAVVSIVYITGRAEPRLDWFIDSLANQLADAGADPGAVELIAVDGRHSPERVAEFVRILGDRFAMRHVAPKPTPYGGPHRLTERSYSAISSARNTGIVYAGAPYIAFVDDSCLLADGWWRELAAAAEHGYVIAGAYENRVDMTVEHGRLLEGGGPRAAPAAIDSRWEVGDDEALVQIVGGQLFGCSLGAPHELLLECNGFDELCDPIGGEDSNLGIRLEWSGARIFYSRRMLAIKDGERHRHDTTIRLDRGQAVPSPLDDERYMSCLREFGVGRRTLIDGACDCSHLCLDLLYGTRSTRALGNYYELAELSEADLPGLPARFPERYWATAEPISAL
ncbi:MAG TPA: glycosyltransferase family 2 protein [Solirubrobacteraceae bacterium]|jgi:glycosyltransferase involved in cell wall biosynthesis|nr:glycosyltransferase family 2 protein [Solirubrobacteraceae bacterium]